MYILVQYFQTCKLSLVRIISSLHQLMVFGIHHGPVEGKTIVAPKCIDGRVSLKGHIHEQVVRRKGQTGRLGAKRIASDNGKVLAGAEIEKSTMETK